MAADPTSPARDGALGAAPRAAWIGLGVGLAAVAAALPADLVPPVPQVPIDGTTLARLALALTALTALVVGALGRRLPRIGAADRLSLPAPSPGGAVRFPLAWLAAITGLAAALRLYALGGSLWLDEILGVRWASGPFLGLLVTPTSLNNHLFHTFLVRGMIELAGPQEWAIRLPAVVLGIATAPAVYLLARVALRPREALLSALVVATSYHHILFSQSSRGYAGLILWTVLATWFLLRALTADQAVEWAGFAATSFLAGGTVLLGGFTLVGQAAVLGLVAHRVRRDGGNPRPIVAKALIVIAAVGLVLFDLYAAGLPRMYRRLSPVHDPFSGYAGPMGFWYELGRGLVEGFGATGLVAIALGIVLVIPGAVLFVRRHAVVCAFLCAPVAALGAVIALIGLYAMPRYFVWAVVPFAIGIVGAAAAGPPRAARWAPLVLAAVVAAGSLSALRSYYAKPFQASRESVETILRESSPGDVVVAVRPMGWLVQFYGPRLGLARTRTVVEIDSLAQLRDIERGAPERQLWLLTSNWLLITNRGRGLSDHIDRCYRRVRAYPARVHRMEITLWSRQCRIGEGR